MAEFEGKLKDLLQGVTKHPVKSAFLFLIISKILRANINENSTNPFNKKKESVFTESISVVFKSKKGTIMFDSDSNSYGVMYPDGKIDIFPNEREARKVLGERLTKRPYKMKLSIDMRERLTKLSESIHLEEYNPLLQCPKCPATFNYAVWKNKGTYGNCPKCGYSGYEKQFEVVKDGR